MKLRNQLLTLSLATLLVPWFGWKLLQELEQFLRAGQEGALLASAQTIAQALPVEHQTILAFGREQALALRSFDDPPIMDGYADDWPEPGSAMSFISSDGELSLELMAGRYANQLYLFARVSDDFLVRASPLAGGVEATANPSDEVLLFLRSARGLNHFRIRSAAPGSLLINSQVDGGGQLEAYWLDSPQGYQLEIALPPAARVVDLAIGAVDIRPNAGGRVAVREAGTLQDRRPASWLHPVQQSESLRTWLAGVIPDGARAWVVDNNGWVLAGTGPAAALESRQLSWAERVLYRLVAGGRTELAASRPESVLRFEEAVVENALKGEPAQHWGQDPDNAAVHNTVAVPVFIDGQQRGAVVLEAGVDGLLLVTNRALGRLLLSTLLVTVGLAAGLWFFASRLSRRVQRLSGAVSEAMDDAAQPRSLPLTGDSDELGELARNNAQLLRAVASYTGYLNKLAGRLSHELKTPLAITRSSLDNLDSHELDGESRRYLARAREGLDRQTAIVRAMSEANRLEAAVKAADWESANLTELLRNCIDGYRTVHPGREIRLSTPAQAMPWTCAPDLLVQALDKLIDNAVSMTTPADYVEIILEDGTDDCLIKVRNSGSRLPDTLQDQLFDSLVSVRDGKAEGVHLGLGLHIVRLVAEAHGGTVSARNLESGDGVEFTISLAER